MDYVAVLYDIFFALQTPFPSVFCSLLAIASDVVVVANNFGTNKAFLKICVNLARCVGGGGAYWDSPGAYFFDASGEVGLWAQLL